MFRLTATLHEDFCTFMIMSRSVPLTINVSDYDCSENGNTQFVFKTFK